MDKERTCRVCNWWVGCRAGDRICYGSCCKRAPVVDNSGSIHINYRFPITSSDNGCGDWERMKEGG